MKLTRDDFKLYDASYNDDRTEVWIERRVFKKKFWLFGDLVPTNDFAIILDDPRGLDGVPVAHSSPQLSEQFIEEEIKYFNENHQFLHKYQDI